MLKFNLEQEISQRNIQWSPGFDTQKVPHGNGYNKKTNTTSKFGIRIWNSDLEFGQQHLINTFVLGPHMKREVSIKKCVSSICLSLLFVSYHV